MKHASTLSTQVRILQRTVQLSEGRIDTTKAERIIDHVDSRLNLKGNYTTVAVAGATGSGKSTTVNALVANQAMRVSLRRPTTSVPVAAVGVSNVDPAPLLDWLGIIGRSEVLTRECRDLIVIDMPDTDSIFKGNRLEVDRLVDMVDLIIWVVDPQKYADRILHRDYLKELVPYASVMLVVLNRIDELEPQELDACTKDLRKLLDEDGLAATPLVAVSAASGDVRPIRDWLETQQGSSVLRRLEGDVAVAAEELEGALGRYSPKGVVAEDVESFVDDLVVAAGVPGVVDKVGEAWALRGAAATAWPLVSVWKKFGETPQRAALGAEILPAQRRYQANATQQAKADTALRKISAEATFGLPQSWATAACAVAWDRRQDLMDRLETVLVETDFGVRNGSRWWRVLAGIQWTLLGVIGLAMIWWILGAFQLVTIPNWGTIPWPPIVAGIALLAGVAIAGLGKMLAPWDSIRKADSVEQTLRAAVEKVADEEVLEVLREETDQFQDAIATLARLRG